MKAEFQDMQDRDNALNGTSVSDVKSVHALFKSFSGRQPFGFLLIGDNGMTLTLGYSDECGTVQHGTSDGAPPYLMAVNEVVADDDEEYVEFLAGGTPTPIPKKYCLPVNAVEAIAAEFVASGNRSAAVAWEEI